MLRIKAWIIICSVALAAALIGCSESKQTQAQEDYTVYLYVSPSNYVPITYDYTTVSESDASYILNTNSMIIHIPSCSSVATMAEHNKMCVSDIQEPLQDGFRYCNRCIDTE